VPKGRPMQEKQGQAEHDVYGVRHRRSKAVHGLHGAVQWNGREWKKKANGEAAVMHEKSPSEG
jgi:hypothetical protein